MKEDINQAGEYEPDSPDLFDDKNIETEEIYSYQKSDDEMDTDDTYRDQESDSDQEAENMFDYQESNDEVEMDKWNNSQEHYDDIELQDRKSDQESYDDIESEDIYQDSDSEIDSEMGLSGNENQNKKGQLKSTIIELLIYAIVAAVCLLIIPRYVVQRTIVSGSSMENTLLSGDNLIVEKVSYHFDQPSRFDVVVFYPHGKKEEEYYVKRVIGLPGETVQIKGPSIYINGELLEEHYGKDPIDFSGIAKEPLTLGDDEYFLMGDNREVSLDSRYEEVGPVHAKLIAGRAVFRIWPLNKIGKFE